MENLYFKFLIEFEKTGLSSKKSISPFIEKHFKKPTANSEEFSKWHSQNRDLDLFLQDIRNTGHFDFESYESSHIRPGRWYDIVDVNARITISGLAYLEGYKSDKIISRNSNLQTAAIFLTVFFTIASFIISGLNYLSEKSKSTLETQLSEQSRQIHTLQIELSKSTNELLHLKGENKTSIKKT